MSQHISQRICPSQWRLAGEKVKKKMAPWTLSCSQFFFQFPVPGSQKFGWTSRHFISDSAPCERWTALFSGHAALLLRRNWREQFYRGTDIIVILINRNINRLHSPFVRFSLYERLAARTHCEKELPTAHSTEQRARVRTSLRNKTVKKTRKVQRSK